MDSPRQRAFVILALACLTAVPFAFVAGPRVMRHKAPLRPAVEVREAIVIPDVVGVPYVFAKETLEDAGLAWRVSGARGYPANTVVAQSPRPGTRVVNTGAPLVTLKIKKNRTYAERGVPEQRSPYRATALQLARSS
jgi:PASTA domain